jgi:putative pyruvate formate lyase activating enzyme
VGYKGSGTIFFTNCNLRCLFCQNYTISQLGEGLPVSKEQVAEMMLSLQTQGCHNINLVSPTHVVPQVLEALELAAEKGLELPLVYNTGGYDSAETLEVLDGIVNIYMPDMKYSADQTAETISGIRDYPAVNRAAVKEMHRQVGDLQFDPPHSSGVAWRGLLVRHLVLPGGLAGTGKVVRFLAEEISPHTYLNIMSQYRPCYKADRVPQLTRPITRQEHQEAINLARQHGLERLDGVRSPLVLRLI